VLPSKQGLLRSSSLGDIPKSREEWDKVSSQSKDTEMKFVGSGSSSSKRQNENSNSEIKENNKGNDNEKKCENENEY